MGSARNAAIVAEAWGAVKVIAERLREVGRSGWNELDDAALPGALKAVRDELAAWLGLADDRRRPGLA